MELLIVVMLPLSEHTESIHFVGVFDDQVLAEAAIVDDTLRLGYSRPSLIIPCKLNQKR